ncbi:hypothetical protein MMC14_005422 [Varicellaria rhodocarpa]|nr:hypothetical protein [Varicellaria rhodocarpa]
MGFRNCVFASLRVLQIMVTMLTLGFVIYVINLSHKLEHFREDGDKELTNLIAEHPSVAEHIDEFIKKVLGVPKRVWFLLFVSIWTSFVISYKSAANKWFPTGTRRAYMVPLELLTLILWLLGFAAELTIALEIEPLCYLVDFAPFLLRFFRVCPFSKGASAAGALGCLCWTTTAIMACCGGRRKSPELTRTVEAGVEMRDDPQKPGFQVRYQALS